MHSLLRRQLDKLAGGAQRVPAEWRQFVEAVDQAYKQSDADRAMLERSLELSSHELMQSNSEMRAVFQALPDMFMRVRRDGTILELRGAGADDFCIDPSGITGKQLREVSLREMAEALAEPVERCFSTREFVSAEYLVNRDGDDRHFEARLLPLLDDQLMVLIRNVTNQRQVERELAAQAIKLANSNTELEQFAYIASHDLQEPLRTVQSYLQLIERRYGDKLDSDGKEFIAFAKGGATRMRELINDLLMYARLSSRAKPLEPTPLSAIADEVVAALTAAITEAKATVVYGELPVVPCDRRQMAQLFQNLIANALKFRGTEPPRVEITAEPRDREWLLAVRDNGIGIEPKHLDRIFVIFQRLHSREEYPGTGIGLAVCRKIVERHRGRIWAESRPREGATFFFTLPEGAA